MIEEKRATLTRVKRLLPFGGRMAEAPPSSCRTNHLLLQTKCSVDADGERSDMNKRKELSQFLFWLLPTGDGRGGDCKRERDAHIEEEKRGWKIMALYEWSRRTWMEKHAMMRGRTGEEGNVFDAPSQSSRTEHPFNSRGLGRDLVLEGPSQLTIVVSAPPTYFCLSAFCPLSFNGCKVKRTTKRSSFLGSASRPTKGTSPLTSLCRMCIEPCSIAWFFIVWDSWPVLVFLSFPSCNLSKGKALSYRRRSVVPCLYRSINKRTSVKELSRTSPIKERFLSSLQSSRVLLHPLKRHILSTKILFLWWVSISRTFLIFFSLLYSKIERTILS